MSELRRGLGLTLLAAGLSGCLGYIEPDYLVPSKRIEKVRDVADSYGQNLRFGRIVEAAAFVRPEDRRAFLEAFQRIAARLEFTNAEILSVDSVDATTVEVLASYEVFAMPSLQIRSFTERQLWYYDAMKRTWLVQPDLAAFTGPGGSAPVSGR
jgi:hypothetical protein